MGVNHGLRIETNYPVISKSSVIVNLYANYWQSAYGSSATFDEPNQSLARNLNAHPLHSISVGAILFKPLSVKSMLLFEYELERQSYFTQTSSSAPMSTFSSGNELELRKFEIRTRIQLRQSLTDFIWLDAQAGVRVAYRFDLDENEASTEPVLENNIGMPLYFRISIALVSP